MKNLENKIKSLNGITLIALVITIVVLIILAAVTINLILGDKGISERAMIAKQQQDYATAKETLELKLVNIYIECMQEGKEFNIKEVSHRFGLTDEQIVMIKHYYFESVAQVDSNLNTSHITNANLNISGIIVTIEGYSQYQFLIGKRCIIEGVAVNEIDEEIEIWSGEGIPEYSSFQTIDEFEREKLGQLISTSIAKDTTKPTITIENMQASEYLFGINAVVKLSDEGAGLNFNRCKYVFTNSIDEIGTNESLYTDGNISNENETIDKLKEKGTWYLHVLAVDISGNKTEAVSENAITIDNVANYDYTGNVKTVRLLPGNYKLEIWGAQGGFASSTRGGYGGYSTGEISLSESEELYIVVGGQGVSSSSSGVKNISGGYNGGGYGRQAESSSLRSSSGGGATHIAQTNNRGVLANYNSYRSEVLIVAGGGAGGYGYSSKWWNGNSGGGYVGGYSNSYASAGNQTEGYDFGQGGGKDESSIEQGNSINQSGGGGGWFGGHAWYGEVGSGGGSGYIGNLRLFNKHMTGYDVTVSDEDSTRTISTNNVSQTPTSDYAKIGNGYARITNLCGNGDGPLF